MSPLLDVTETRSSSPATASRSIGCCTAVSPLRRPGASEASLLAAIGFLGAVASVAAASPAWRDWVKEARLTLLAASLIAGTLDEDADVGECTGSAYGVAGAVAGVVGVARAVAVVALDGSRVTCFAAAMTAATAGDAVAAPSARSPPAASSSLMLP